MNDNQNNNSIPNANNSFIPPQPINNVNQQTQNLGIMNMTPVSNGITPAVQSQNQPNNSNQVVLGSVNNTVATGVPLPSANNPASNQITPSVIPQQQPNVTNNNQFINQNVNNNQNVHNEASINDLNIDGTYNNMNVKPDYVNDPKVLENMNEPKKNTIKVNKEMKTFILIALFLLVFIILMPVLFDLLNKVRFH